MAKYHTEDFKTNGKPDLQLLLDSISDKDKSVIIDFNSHLDDLDDTFVYEIGDCKYKQIHRRTYDWRGNLAKVRVKDGCDGFIPEIGDNWYINPNAEQRANGAIDVLVHMETHIGKDLNIIGGGIGFETIACLHNKFENVNFFNCEMGMVHTFNLFSVFDQVHFTNCYNSVAIDSGDSDYLGAREFVNGTENNSGSNQSEFRNCRIYNRIGSQISFYGTGANGLNLKNCSFEGFNPEVMFYYEGKGNTIRKVLLESTHVECDATQYSFYVTNLPQFENRYLFNQSGTNYHSEAGLNLLPTPQWLRGGMTFSGGDNWEVTHSEYIPSQFNFAEGFMPTIFNIKNNLETICLGKKMGWQLKHGRTGDTLGFSTLYDDSDPENGKLQDVANETTVDFGKAKGLYKHNFKKELIADGFTLEGDKGQGDLSKEGEQSLYRQIIIKDSQGVKQYHNVLMSKGSKGKTKDLDDLAKLRADFEDLKEQLNSH